MDDKDLIEFVARRLFQLNFRASDAEAWSRLAHIYRRNARAAIDAIREAEGRNAGAVSASA